MFIDKEINIKNIMNYLNELKLLNDEIQSLKLNVATLDADLRYVNDRCYSKDETIKSIIQEIVTIKNGIKILFYMICISFFMKLFL